MSVALVLAALAFSAGGVAISVRAGSPEKAAAAETQPAQADQCGAQSIPPVRMNERAAALAAKDDMVPLNTQGYNYGYEGEWRPDAAPASAPDSVPAAPAKP